MTREEAINNLNMISVAFVEPVTKEQRKLIDDTFNMAIEALKAIDDIKAKFHAKAEMYEDGEYYLSEELIDKIINKHMKEGDA